MTWKEAIREKGGQVPRSLSINILEERVLHRRAEDRIGGGVEKGVQFWKASLASAEGGNDKEPLRVT